MLDSYLEKHGGKETLEHKNSSSYKIQHWSLPTW